MDNHVISELVSFDSYELADIDGLMKELSESSECTEERLLAVMRDPNAHLFVARSVPACTSGCEVYGLEAGSGKIVGCATLCVMNTPEFRLGHVEAVVVSGACRGAGLGHRLMERVVAEARCLGIDSLHLTSNPKRVAANGLYRSMGFEPYDTNCYKMKLSK